MTTDKNLFMYDLAIVAIMKNEGPYVKEWLDYHLLAGADHFYIYDNESPDNMKEVLQPYINTGIVTYIFFPGKFRQDEAYNDAVLKYKFFCRYMAFIDGDEFIFPKAKITIVETIDKILSDKPNASGLAMNWNCFGSNGEEKADYSRGVLERFTRRASEAHILVKSIANPRKINYMDSPHFPRYFEGCSAVNEIGTVVPAWGNDPTTTDKIVVNHYITKSAEEYMLRISRGAADHWPKEKFETAFKTNDRNDVFDDGILKYYNSRKEIYGTGNDTEIFNNLVSSKKINYDKLFNALVQNLVPTFAKNTPREFYDNKPENFLTCLAVATYMKNSILEETAGKSLEEISLNAVFKALHANISISDWRLLLREMPNILQFDYPVVKNICDICIKIIPRIMETFRLNALWKEFSELSHLLQILQTFNKRIMK